MDYSKLSDIEINGRVLHFITNGKAIRLQQASVASGETDYCNNPADSWSIIVQNGISMIIDWDEDGESIDDSTWTATTNINKSWCDEREPGFESTDKNPLRAAMIVFLMMQESE